MAASWIQSNLPSLFGMAARVRSWSSGKSIWRSPTCKSIWRSSTWWPSDSRAAKQKGLLRLIYLAHRQRSTPQPLIANLALEHRGKYRRQLMKLSRRLAEGTPLIDALEQTPDVLSDDTVLAIRFGSQTGTLDQIYPMQCGESSETPNRIRGAITGTVWYCVGMALAIAVTLTFLTVTVLPTYVEMHEEFGISTPWALGRMIEFDKQIGSYIPALIVITILTVCLMLSAKSRRFVRHTIGSWRFQSPNSVQSIALLRLVSATTKAGRPLAAAISTLARYHFDSQTRNKLLYVRNEMEQGADAWSALAETHLLSDQESKSIGSLSADTRSWGMDRLADQKQQWINRRLHNSAQWIRTIAILAFGAIVLWICVAFINPLIDTLA